MAPKGFHEKTPVEKNCYQQHSDHNHVQVKLYQKKANDINQKQIFLMKAGILRVCGYMIR